MSHLTTPLFETLPLIVLERICEYLVEYDSKRRSSLWAFSLTSSYCCSVATAQRFSQIHLTVRRQNNLQESLKRWSEILSIDDRFRYVQRLKVSGLIPYRGREEDIEERLNAPVSEQDEGEDDDDKTMYYFDINDFCQPSQFPIDFKEDSMTLRKDGDLTEAWQPLAHFIGQLPGLEDLVWTYRFQMPQCILSAVHIIGCRLHIYWFRLHSLIQDRNQPRDIDTYEFTIASSPSLYSIFVPFFNYDSYGNVNYNQEAALRMVAGAAPRLAHICIMLQRPGNSIALMNACRTPKPAWSGFFPKTRVLNKAVLGSLQSLVIYDSGLSHEEISNWSRHTDFAKLRRLTINWTNDSYDVAKSLQTLAKMAVGGRFKSLHTLILSIPDKGSRQIQDALTLLLEHLNPLESLDLEGFISNGTFKTALNRHGRTLRKLRVIPWRYYGSRGPIVVFSEVIIQRLAEDCPNLEEVEIPVNRTQGDGREIGIYQALGRLTQLKRVSLKFQFSIGVIEEDDDEEGEEEREEETLDLSSGENIPRANIRDGFINGAIDSSLALSIFNLISSNGSLKSLKMQIVRNEGPGYFDSDLNLILAWIGRSWACECDHQSKVLLRELGKKKRIRMGEDLEYVEEGTFLTVWNDIWPQSTSNWWEGWNSFPLSNGLA